MSFPGSNTHYVITCINLEPVHFSGQYLQGLCGEEDMISDRCGVFFDVIWSSVTDRILALKCDNFDSISQSLRFSK